MRGGLTKDSSAGRCSGYLSDMHSASISFSLGPGPHEMPGPERPQPAPHDPPTRPQPPDSPVVRPGEPPKEPPTQPRPSGRG